MGESEHIVVGPISTLNSENVFFVTVNGADAQTLKRTILVEPVTAGWIAMSIAGGILSGIGSKIFSDLFGDKLDFQAALRNFVHVIEVIIKRQLQEEEKRKLEASSESIQSLFSIYQVTKNQDMLTPLLFKSSEITAQSHSLGIIATNPFMISGGLELAVLQEQYLRLKKPGYKVAIGVRAAALIQSATDFNPSLTAYNNGRFSDLFFGGSIGIFSYTCDGQRFDCWDKDAIANRDGALRQRKRHIDAEYSRLEKEILYPLYGVLAKWKEISQKF